MPSKVKLTSNAAKIRTRLRAAIKGFQDDLRSNVTGALEQGTVGMVVLGLNATVYQTPDGQHYERTGELLRDVNVKLTLRRGVVNVYVGNSSEYAPHVEWGVTPEGVTPDDGVTIAGAFGASPRPLMTGRSGLEYAVPSLAHTRAMVWAMYQLRQDVRDALKKHFR